MYRYVITYILRCVVYEGETSCHSVCRLYQIEICNNKLVLHKHVVFFGMGVLNAMKVQLELELRVLLCIKKSQQWAQFVCDDL